MNSNTVLISGAGIAGPTLAFWLEAAGFQTTLVERAPALRTGGYVIDFWGLGYDVAERMDLRGVAGAGRDRRAAAARRALDEGGGDAVEHRRGEARPCQTSPVRPGKS